MPELARAGALYDSMDFGFYYRPEVNRILFHYAPDTGAAPCCYDTIVSESRIADYIGIDKGELPQRPTTGAGAASPTSATTAGRRRRPVGFNRTLYGVDGLRGRLPVRRHARHAVVGRQHVRGADAALFVPEERWGPGSWGSNHPLTVGAQIHHGLVEAGYGYWGFSPSNMPEGGYSAYGVDAIGMDPNGNPSNKDRTLVDRGFAGCPAAGAAGPAAERLHERRRDAARRVPRRCATGAGEALDEPARLERDFPGASTASGASATRSTSTSGFGLAGHLSLDQGMIMAAIGNALGDDMLRVRSYGGDFERAVRPVIGVEEFNGDPRGCTITGTRGDDRLAARAATT